MLASKATMYDNGYAWYPDAGQTATLYTSEEGLVGKVVNG